MEWIKASDKLPIAGKICYLKVNLKGVAAKSTGYFIADSDKFHVIGSTRNLKIELIEWLDESESAATVQPTEVGEEGSSMPKLIYPSGEDILEALSDLFDAIPSQNSNADWWPDELRKAMEKADDIIHKNVFKK